MSEIQQDKYSPITAVGLGMLGGAFGSYIQHQYQLPYNNPILNKIL